jgi:3-methylcrotonyl-CoA carboxylase alpha subunit
MFDRVLIANRGEIACRVIATCHRLGIHAIAVYSEADRKTRHIKLADEACCIGGPLPAQSYLNAERILAAARESRAQAIHPGYGFLSENAAFARACTEAGTVFIGPNAEAIEQMGSKSAAKRIMVKAGVPVVPGYHGDNQEPQFLLEQARLIGYPLLIKASAGGGGKGMRKVSSDEEFAPQLEAAKREAASAFGDTRVLLERYLDEPHHIEFQVFGDRFGTVVHLFERECSIQRRHQKILEETPSPFLDASLRARMGEAAVLAAKAIGYVNAGTIEFIAGADRAFYFMEMNTRLQVEHPITEMTTGLDLVEWQLRVAAGEALPLRQEEIKQNGHAIEVRIYAENPANEFLPETGTIKRFAHPELGGRVRLDTGVAEGDEIGVFYDPMIAKLSAHAHTRPQAIARMRQALGNSAIVGLKNNIDFLAELIAHPAFVRGDTDTHFIEHHRGDLFQREPKVSDRALAAVATYALLQRETQAKQRAAEAGDPYSPWQLNTGWRLNAESRFSLLFADPLSGQTFDVAVSGTHGTYRLAFDERAVAVEATLNGCELAVSLNGEWFHARVLSDAAQYCALIAGKRYELFEVMPFTFESAEEAPGGGLSALMPGRIVKIFVSPGATVTKGQPLLVMEAMKMEHTIHSPRDGVVQRVHFAENDIVQAEATLFTFEEEK